jgi:DNA-binding PadR family transcriptional regulator
MRSHRLIAHPGSQVVWRIPRGRKIAVQIYLDSRYIYTHIGFMKHRHHHHIPCHGAPEDRRGGGHRRPFGHRGPRPFDYGDLRLLVLGMIADQPSHGYELMKAIEDRMGGGYSPSPGVIYPTLAWLEDMGYAAAEADGGRKRYRVSPEGEAYLAANRSALDELTSRMGERGGRRHGAPEPVIRGMDALKHALRQRFRQGPIDDAAIARIAEALETAAQTVEQS